MAYFIELTESEHAKKILVNLEKVTFIQPSEKKESNATTIHLTSSTYSTDRTVTVTEDYGTVKGFVIKAKLAAEETI